MNAAGLVGRSGFWPPAVWRVGEDEDACAVPLFVICKQTAETSVWGSIHRSGTPVPFSM